MENTDDNKERNDAFDIFNDFISKFNDEGRFILIKYCLETCPMPNIVKIFF
jgi:hypothetical protein